MPVYASEDFPELACKGSRIWHIDRFGINFSPDPEGKPVMLPFYYPQFID